MIYLCIILIILIIVLLIHRIFLGKALHQAILQMTEIEQQPRANRQLRALYFSKDLEKLFIKINEIYKARQQERVMYQRREQQIRREIENISHDLRTPLTSIIGYVDLLQTEDDLSEQEKVQYLDIIKKRARILQGFIQDFYEISRMEGDSFVLNLEAVPVQKLLEETIVAYYNEFENKHITVKLELEESSSVIVADKIQLNRVFTNLIQNALKYARELFIIKQYFSGKNCILQFKNEKGNLTERDLELIFDRFYCGDLSRGNNSTGLGLTIAKILVEKMKGRIEARFEDELFVIELCFSKFE